jgi:hypothetical protein
MEPLPPVSAPVVRTWHRPLVVLPSLVLIAAVGGLFESFTTRANLLVLGVGGALMWLGLTGRAGRRSAPAQLSPRASWWLVPLLALASVELYTFTKDSIGDYPTLSLLADPILDNYVPRAAAYFVWLTGFWALVRR